jgi:hypothetical protein
MVGVWSSMAPPPCVLNSPKFSFPPSEFVRSGRLGGLQGLGEAWDKEGWGV